MFWTFVRVYIIRRGFLDGKQGLILAMMAATGNMYRYSKLWFLQRDTHWHPPMPSPETNKQKDPEDRKSTRLNSSHVAISYAVFCLKKKNKQLLTIQTTVRFSIPTS